MLDHDILAPFSNDSPAGEYLRFETTFDDIKQLRRGLTERLAASGYSHDILEVHTDIIARIGLLLETRTKDIVLVLWLVESVTVFHRFEGLVFGSELLKCFVERYWQIAYPNGDDEDLKSNAIQWFDHDFSKTLGFTALLRTPGQGAKFYSKSVIEDLTKQARFWDKQQIKALKRDEKQKYEEFKLIYGDYDDFCASLDRGILTTDLANIEITIENFQAAADLFQKHDADSVCNFDQAISTLTFMARRIKSALKKLSDSVENDIEPEPASKREENSASQPVQAFGNNQNTGLLTIGPREIERYISEQLSRDAVYEVMTLIIGRLEQLDPNSPNVQLGKKMLQIRDKNFVDILEELVDDKRTRDQVVKLFDLGF
jgi:type VI secretion system ImpA family protein